MRHALAFALLRISVFYGWCALRVFGRSAQAVFGAVVALVLRLLCALVKPTRKPERELHKPFLQRPS